MKYIFKLSIIVFLIFMIYIIYKLNSVNTNGNNNSSLEHKAKVNKKVRFNNKVQLFYY